MLVVLLEVDAGDRGGVGALEWEVELFAARARVMRRGGGGGGGGEASSASEAACETGPAAWSGGSGSAFDSSWISASFCGFGGRAL